MKQKKPLTYSAQINQLNSQNKLFGNSYSKEITLHAKILKKFKLSMNDNFVEYYKHFIEKYNNLCGV